MSQDQRGFSRLGGAGLVAGALFFFIRGLLEFAAGPPPTGGEAILGWVASERAWLAWVSEILFAAAVCLVPGVAALYRSLADRYRSWAVAGCGLIALAIPLLAMSLVVHGRLVYPVYGMRVTTPGSAELVVTLFYGGLHAVNLLMAVAVAVLSVPMRRAGWGTKLAWLGYATALAHLAAAYPDLIGPAPTLACQALGSVWLAAVGVTLYRLP